MPVQAASGTATAGAGPAYSVNQWLARLRQAGRTHAYTGTYAVWSAPGLLASSRIWHVNQGDLQIERVDALSGAPRSTYRAIDRNGGEQVKTFWNKQHVARIERDDTFDGVGFPNLLKAGQGASLADYYEVRPMGQERVAGFMTDVVQLVPRDNLRYSYRVWSERNSGVVVRLQTLDEHGRVLEQAAFFDLAFDAPLNAAALLHEMHQRRGWRIERVTHVPTTARAEGWQIGDASGQPVPGFALQNCYRQSQPGPDAQAQSQAQKGKVAPDAAASASSGAVAAQNKAATAATASSIQCVFSDGLAAVSVFIEPYDPAQHAGRTDEQDWAQGATHLLARRVDGTSWVAAVGEVPPQTLKRFIASVSRRL